MAHKLVTTFTLLIFVLLFFWGLAALSTHDADLPDQVSQHKVFSVEQESILPGGQASLLPDDHSGSEDLRLLSAESSIDAAAMRIA